MTNCKVGVAPKSLNEIFSSPSVRALCNDKTAPNVKHVTLILYLHPTDSSTPHTRTTVPYPWPWSPALPQLCGPSRRITPLNRTSSPRLWTPSTWRRLREVSTPCVSSPGRRTLSSTCTSAPRKAAPRPCRRPSWPNSGCWRGKKGSGWLWSGIRGMRGWARSGSRWLIWRNAVALAILIDFALWIGISSLWSGDFFRWGSCGEIYCGQEISYTAGLLTRREISGECWAFWSGRRVQIVSWKNIFRIISTIYGNIIFRLFINTYSEGLEVKIRTT